MFLKILQNLQENTCARVSFSTFFFNFIKKRLWHRCFPVKFVKFLRTPFLHNTFSGWFWIDDKRCQRQRHWHRSVVLFLTLDILTFFNYCFQCRLWIDFHFNYLIVGTCIFNNNTIKNTYMKEQSWFKIYLESMLSCKYRSIWNCKRTWLCTLKIHILKIEPTIESVWWTCPFFTFSLEM